MNIYLYETRASALKLEPITLTRTVFELRCGAFTFLERLRLLRSDGSVSLFVREELVGITEARFDELAVNPQSVSEGLWLNSAVLWSEALLKLLESKGGVLTSDGCVVGAHLSSDAGQKWLEAGGPVETPCPEILGKEADDLKIITYLWDCINENGHAIEEDATHFPLGEVKGDIDDGVHILNRDNIYVPEGTKVKAGAILDGESGPVIIGENVTVQSGAYLEGPLYVGDCTLIKAGAKIFGETSLGHGCKIGGEVAESIFQSWSNKQHDGFIGHAYIGEWVNLGAGTNNSDLKNNYTSVEVTVHGELIDTGSLFVGLFMGDHSKSAIGTPFNTGTIVGPACNVVAAGFPPKVIPPFSWVMNREFQKYNFQKFVETAKAVKERRGQLFSEVEESFFRRIAENNNK